MDAGGGRRRGALKREAAETGRGPASSAPVASAEPPATAPAEGEHSGAPAEPPASAAAKGGRRGAPAEQPGGAAAEGGRGGATVRLECFSWVGRELGLGERGNAVLELPLSDGLTVGTLLARLAAESEAFERLVYDLEGGHVREYVALLLNDRMIELVGGLGVRLHPGDRLLLLPGFSGG